MGFIWPPFSNTWYFLGLLKYKRNSIILVYVHRLMSFGHCCEICMCLHSGLSWRYRFSFYLKCSVLCCGCNIFSYLIQALCSAMMSPFNMMYEAAICEVISRMPSSTCVLDAILTKLFNLYLPWTLQETRTAYLSFNSGISQRFWNPNHIVYRNGRNVSFDVVYM